MLFSLKCILSCSQIVTYLESQLWFIIDRSPIRHGNLHAAIWSALRVRFLRRLAVDLLRVRTNWNRLVHRLPYVRVRRPGAMPRDQGAGEKVYPELVVGRGWFKREYSFLETSKIV